MRTSRNGKPAEWTETELREYNEIVAPYLKERGHTALTSNRFYPRPYRNEYDRGSTDQGFATSVALEAGGHDVIRTIFSPNEADR